jgi:hypothetical protein
MESFLGGSKRIYLRIMSTLLIHPLFVEIPRRTMKPRKVHLSTNVWLNTHHRVRTQVKEIVRDNILAQLLASTPIVGKIRVSMVLYTPNTNCDLGNFCDVISKICQDTVVKAGLLVDDSVKHILEEHRRYGGVDKKYPRLEITYSTL